MDRELIKGSLLFKGLGSADFEAALKMLQAAEKTYRRGEILLRAGDGTELMGLVQRGSVNVEMNDAAGERTIISHSGRGQFFGETYALLPGTVLPVEVVAAEETSVCWLRFGTFWEKRCAVPGLAEALTRNLLWISLNKNRSLTQRNFHLSPKTIRGKVLAYLTTLSLQKRLREFSIPFDRNQLADYLNVDRCALSKELGKMRKDGLIEFRKNRFRLL